MFIKTNSTGYADALVCEAEGLESLRAALAQAGEHRIAIPEVYRVNERVLETTRVEVSRPSPKLLSDLGEGLAGLHQLRQASYGWSRDNYIGLNPQRNGWHESWGGFFVENRLGYQVSLIQDDRVRAELESALATRGEALAHWLDARCAHASLLHGDLWRGNVLFDVDRIWLIDPAVYCGDREADLAMTEMFGGFGEVFYQAYDRCYPRSDDYPVKRNIYNLYHYLNHYNLFGAGYLDGCRRGLRAIEFVTG